MKDKGLFLIVKFVLEAQRLEYFQAGRLAAASFEDLSSTSANINFRSVYETAVFYPRSRENTMKAFPRSLSSQ